jgi:hypothetical protein
MQIRGNKLVCNLDITLVATYGESLLKIVYSIGADPSVKQSRNYIPCFT